MTNKTIFTSVLVIGVGPVGLVLYALLKAAGIAEKVGLKARSGRSLHLLQTNLLITNNNIKSKTPLPNYQQLNKTAVVNPLELELDNLQDKWETIFLCIPCAAYLEIILRLQKLQRIKHLVLVSPEFGSGILVNSALKNTSVEIISLSNYFGASLISPKDAGVINTLGVKEKIFVGGSGGPRASGLKKVVRFLKSYKINSIFCPTGIIAESKNITSFVHLPFVFNQFSLREFFSPRPSKKYLYKLYPEGPITRITISKMLELHQEINQLYEKMNVPKFNLLEFLNDNYPVPEEVITKNEIKKFPEYNKELQEYLLYVRYATLLIDPYSKPNEEGHYLEFSKFPYQQVYKQACEWHIPRIPLEDYYKLELLGALTHTYGTKNNVIGELLCNYKISYKNFSLSIGNEKINKHSQLVTREKEAHFIWQVNKAT